MNFYAEPPGKVEERNSKEQLRIYHHLNNPQDLELVKTFIF